MSMKITKYIVAAAAAVPAVSMAAPVDLTSLTSAVDMSTTITALLAVSAILIGVYVALRASRIVESKVRGR